MSRYGSMSELCEDEFLDKEIEKGESVKCIKRGSDGLVGELLKYGGSRMVYSLEQLFWCEETVPKRALFKKGDREDPGNYRGITLLSVVSNVFCKYLTIDWYNG